jgi:hypothetical protein
MELETPEWETGEDTTVAEMHKNRRNVFSSS